MPEPYFQFKQFRVHHQQAAFKVGTDGVLLGAWAPIKNGDCVMDIGTGSGLLSLMVAQRGASQITAIDVDEPSVKDAQLNFRLSPFGGLKAQTCHLADLSTASFGTFNLIVSNPPYFSQSTPAASASKHRARHTDSLSPALLFSKATELLTSNGRVAIVIPERESPYFIEAASTVGFYVTKVCHVIPQPGSHSNRFLLEFALVEQPIHRTELLIMDETGHFSPDYIALLGPFMLRF